MRRKTCKMAGRKKGQKKTMGTLLNQKKRFLFTLNLKMIDFN
jgi:hypothetical protein